ncbi:fatty acid desaturase family protein [Ramlibacter albus]|uniref:Fatty acid desaturase n=1 Tax=Ramlibacter albus TaxID=2079448 RepID=A0A923S264_9BURK|nr:fatty acid desaturase [Ramlibacter albus]MBC5764423.1 fatty acid desaturase [Ramlibacter albus]
MDPQPTGQLRAARAQIVQELGTEQLARLHRGNLFLDALAIFGAPLLFLACAWHLATGSVRDVLWWVALIVQGDLVLVMAFINHDAFVHRKLFAPRLRWVLGSILVWPTLVRAAVYEKQHLTHHRALGTEDDSELYKMGIDTPLKRLAYASPLVVVYRSFFLGGKTAALGRSDAATAVKRADPARDRWERGTRLALFATAAASLAWDWRFVVLGYLLPFVLVTPPINTMRIVLEHFDLERGNPLWVGTFYRTGPLTRLAFWWDAGDCHLVHHFYANIPFYRVGEALRLMRPIMARAGVLEQRSLPRLLLEWFSGARQHWSVPGPARNS